MADNDLFEAVLKHADIVQVVSSYVPVTKKGRSHVCICPFHDDKHPSMNISQEKQIFKCFVCGEGGNAISFVQKMEKIPYREALAKVAEISGYDDPRLHENAYVPVRDESKERLYRVLGDTQNYYRYSLSIPEGEKARAYLENRGLDRDIQQRFGIGFSPSDGQKTVAYLQAKKHSLKAIEDSGVGLPSGKDRYAGRITFALYNPNGQVNGFSARIYEAGQEGGKYVNSPEGPIFHKGENLYNYHNAVAAARIEGAVYLCEGFMDVIALYKAGIKAAVAAMGTALTKGQIELLRKLKCEIRLCLDGDMPGQEATIKNGAALTKAGIPYSIVDYQGDNRDPDEILNQEGAEALVKRLNTRITPFDFALKFYSAKADTLDVNERKHLAERFLPYLRETPAGLQYEDLLNRIADATGFHKEAIRELAQAKANEDTVEEQPVFVQGRILPPRNAEGDKDLMRLVFAEKMFVHYMLTNEEARTYYKEHALLFKGKTVHEEIANYLLEYETTHPGDIDIGQLSGHIAQIEGEQSQDTIKELTSIALEEDIPPYQAGCLEKLDTEIHQLNDRLTAVSSAKSIMASGTSSEKAKANKEFVERLRQKRKKRG